MAWDFSTEPEFEEKLAWMRGFVRDEVFPLETLDLDYDQVRALVRPLQEQVKAQGLWAAHLPPALGGMGFGQVRLGLMHEILGQSPLAPVVFGNNAPDSGNAELLAVGIEMSGDDSQRAQWLRAVARRGAALGVLDDRARCGRIRPDAVADLGCARRRRVGDQRAQVVHLQRIGGGLLDRDGGDQSRRPSVPGVVDDHRAGRRRRGWTIVRDVATMEDPGHGVRALREPRRDSLRRRAGAGREPGGKGGLGLRAGAAAARPGTDPPLHALAGAVAAGLRHALRAGGLALRARIHAGREADHPELGRRLHGGDGGGPADDPAGGVEDGSGGGARRPGSRSP